MSRDPSAKKIKQYLLFNRGGPALATNNPNPNLPIRILFKIFLITRDLIIFYVFLSRLYFLSVDYLSYPIMHCSITLSFYYHYGYC